MKATDKQIENIEQLYKLAFGDFEKFSKWLVENFGYFSYLDIDKKTASEIIKKLKSISKKDTKKDTKKSGFWSSIIRVIAKVYLKGFYDGREKKTPLNLEELEEIIKKELLNDMS